MTDTTQQTNPAPTDDKNPLDILENILKEAKAKGEDGQKSDGPTPEELEAAKEAQELEAAKVVMEQKKQEDQEQLVAQIGQLKTITDTPEYKARVEQEEEKKASQEAADDANQGYDIKQVGHTKV